MKNNVFILALIPLFLYQPLTGQNWTTHCGGNERNGRSELPGPHNIDTPLWTISNATPTSLGMNVYSFGNLFVTSRVSFSPYKAIIECRNLLTGELVWTSPDLGTESILYSMGFNEDAVYAHDYHSSLFYAFDASDGSIKWVSDFTSYTFAPMDGVIYTCERDIIINGELGSVNESTLCIDKETGEVLWSNSNWFAVTPNETKAAHGDHLYMITGALNQPKKLVAVDINTGESLYYSEDLPGDGDQEGPIAISQEGTIFFQRDGGDLFAVKDDGSEFSISWTKTPVNMSLFVMSHGVDHDGNLLVLDNGRVYRLDKSDGSPLDSSLVNVVNDGRITVGADSVVYVNNTSGGYYALSHDLQTTLWSIPNLNGNYYAGPSISREGIMVISGSGTTIKAYQYNGPHAPVSDFAASHYHILNGSSIDFTDQSSFGAASWHWEFPGGDPASSDEQHPQGITYNEAGLYSVTLITANEFGTDTMTKPCYIEVTLLEGIESNLNPAGITVYPNPVKRYTTIRSDEAAEIAIFNVIGEVIYRDAELKREHRIDFSGFHSGLYIARLSGRGFIRSANLVVDR